MKLMWVQMGFFLSHLHADAAWGHLPSSCLRVGFCRIQSEAIEFIHFRFYFCSLGVAFKNLKFVNM